MAPPVITKQWDRDSIIQLLMVSDKAVERAIVAIYKRQTDEEKREEKTKFHNGRGFLPYHARRGSMYARIILSGRQLFPDRMALARQMAIKYSRQLLEEVATKKAA